VSTVSKHPARRSVPTPAESDPNCYGWRFARVTKPDGTEAIEQVPLTLEDVLHPEEGYNILHTKPHGVDLTYLNDVFNARLEHDPTAVVLWDVGVNWNLPGVKPLCPDISVFLGARRQAGFTIFDVAKEGARPAMVVEVTSPSTRTIDLGAKVDYYYRAKVPLYVIADVLNDGGKDRRIKLIGYERTPRRYKRVKPNDRDWIWLDPLRLWLGVKHDPVLGYNRLASLIPTPARKWAPTRRLQRRLRPIRMRAPRPKPALRPSIAAPRPKPGPGSKPRAGFVSLRPRSSDPNGENPDSRLRSAEIDGGELTRRRRRSLPFGRTGPSPFNPPKRSRGGASDR